MAKPKDSTIMIRAASDEYRALKVAQAMHNVGAEIISVTVNGGNYAVWAKIDPATIDKIDEEITHFLATIGQPQPVPAAPEAPRPAQKLADSWNAPGRG